MRKTSAVILKWIGRLLLIAVPYVILASLFAPRGVQFLNPVVCEKGQQLDNRSIVATGDGHTASSIELVCRVDRATVNVTARILLIVAVLVAGAFVAFAYSSRLSNPRYRVPEQPRQQA